MNDPSLCSHLMTVEIYKGITKCSNCGDIWDERSDEDRREGLEAGEKMREDKAKRIEYYLWGRRRNRNSPTYY